MAAVSIVEDIVIATGPQWQVNIGSGNGLVPSRNKPLPKPMLTIICVAIWHCPWEIFMTFK